MKDPLKAFTIAVTGDFGARRSHEKIRQWIEANKGTYAAKITSDVTHLVCSRDHLKNAVPMVRHARRIQGLHIVNFDWLEDSLMKMSPRKEGAYLLERQVRATQKARKERKALKEENIRKGLEAFEKGCQDSVKELFSNGYHICRDPDGFNYDITLVRANLVINKNERYQLKLFETHTEPMYYATFVKYSSPGATAKEVLAPIGSSFSTAYDAFKKFFRLKTRREWDERLLKTPLPVEHGDKPAPFVYNPPADGEPNGIPKAFGS